MGENSLEQFPLIPVEKPEKHLFKAPVKLIEKEIEHLFQNELKTEIIDALIKSAKKLEAEGNIFDINKVTLGLEYCKTIKDQKEFAKVFNDVAEPLLPHFKLYEMEQSEIEQMGDEMEHYYEEMKKDAIAFINELRQGVDPEREEEIMENLMMIRLQLDEEWEDFVNDLRTKKFDKITIQKILDLE